MQEFARTPKPFKRINVQATASFSNLHSPAPLHNAFYVDVW